MELFVKVIALVLGVAIVLVALTFGFASLIFRLLGKLSGLDRLAHLYPAEYVSAENLFSKQRIGVGSVYYRNSADIGISSHGLYIWVRSYLSKYKPVLIPWNELKDPQPTILALRNAVRCKVGNPKVTSIVLLRPLFEKIKPYLKNE